MVTFPSTRYRTIFISDFHIGAKSFNAPSLLDFLKKTESEQLYLVGDIIDGWKLNKRWHWSETINEIFDELARKVAEGTEIIYVPGNHDDAVRAIPVLKRLGFARRLGIRISDKIVHKTADGRRFLVMHGDQFDTRLLSSPVLKTHHFISDLLGRVLTVLRQAPPMIEINGQMKKFSLGKYLSKHGRLAVQTLNNFEGMVYALIKRKNLDGIICGHTHIPVLKRIKDITYANTGSWLRNGNTAMVEDWDGNLSLLEWMAEDADLCAGQYAFAFDAQNQARIFIRANSLAYRPVTRFVVKKIYKIWSPARYDIQAARAATRSQIMQNTLSHARRLVTGHSVRIQAQGPSLLHLLSITP